MCVACRSSRANWTSRRAASRSSTRAGSCSGSRRSPPASASSCCSACASSLLSLHFTLQASAAYICLLEVLPLSSLLFDAPIVNTRKTSLSSSSPYYSYCIFDCRTHRSMAWRVCGKDTRTRTFRELSSLSLYFYYNTVLCVLYSILYL